jgi:DNA-binding transcriptional ArsR family regulator
MDAHHSLSSLAAAIAEPARARMLCALLDGRARTATELCALSDLAASTTSAHLARLVDQELLVCMPQGRHRYYALHGPDVAAALESMLAVAGRSTGSKLSSVPASLREARTCYDHLAGTLAVALLDWLLAQGWLERAANRAFALRPRGERGLVAWGVEVDAARTARRHFACACVDWSERRPHLAGALGAALLDAALRRRWLMRDADSRAVQVSAKGRREWLDPLGLTSLR